MPLAIDSFLADPRIAAARQSFLQTLADHQQSLTHIRAADPARQRDYETLLQHFAEARAGQLYFPYLASGFGHGPFVELADGSVKLDFISGIGVHHFGHAHPALVEAALNAALRDTIMQGNLQQNVESAPLAASLLKLANQTPGANLAHAFFTSSGAMANENALKLAFHKKPGAARILAFDHAFAGRTLALSTITDKPAYRLNLPTALPVDYLPFLDASDPAASTARTLAAFETLTARYPNQHAALWAEFIQGEGGFYVGDQNFFQQLFTAARAKKIAIVADEVQTFGRTSRPFAFQHFNLAALVDIVTVGKMLQLCATLFSDAFRPGPGLLSQTFTASTSAIFSAQTILDSLLSQNLFGPTGRNMQVHTRFVDHFERIRTQNPALLKGPFGLGGMIAFTPLDGSDATAKSLLSALFHNGLIAFSNGSHPTRIRFLPPIPALTNDHIDTACTILEQTLIAMASAPP